MNDETTTDGDDAPDERVVAALRDVEPASPTVRRAHLDAALAEYDRVVADTPVAPVVPLRRRSTRVLQVAAAVLLVVVGAAVVVQVGRGTSGQDDRASSGAESVTSAGAGAGAAADGAAESAPGLSTSEGDQQSQQDTTSRAYAGGGADKAAASTSVPSPVAGVASGTLGDYPTDAALRADVALRAGDGTLPSSVAPRITCARPAGINDPGEAATATVAGQPREVWIQRNPDGSLAALVVVDPVTCLPIT